MRYRFDLGLIIDQETGEVLEGVAIRNRLNKYEEENKELKELLNEVNKDNLELREAMKRMMADMMTGGLR